MNRRIRTTTALVAAAGLALAVAACSPGSGADGDGGKIPDGAAGAVSTDIAALGEVTLTVWDQEVRGGQDEQIKKLNQQFQEKYPNVKINRVSQSFDDLATTLRLALTDKEAPDVVQANNARNTMGAFVEAGQLLALDEYAKAYGWTDRYSPSVLTYSTYGDGGKVFGEGSLYGLPQVGEVVGVFYAKGKLAALGLEPAADWAAFGEALAKAKAAGEIPLVLGNIDKWPAIHVFGPLQGNFVPAQQVTDLGLGNPGATWTSPENVEAATLLQDWAKAGYFNDGPNGTDYDAAWQDFAAGNGVFLIGGSWLAADLEDAMGEDVGFFVPNAKSGQPATTGGTGLPFAITKASANPDAAAAYIDFLTSDAAMQVLAETGNLPVNRTAELAPATGVQADVYKTFGRVTGEGSLLPYLDYATPTFSDTLGAALQELIDGQATPQQFADKLEADYSAFAAANG